MRCIYTSRESSRKIVQGREFSTCGSRPLWGHTSGILHARYLQCVTLANLQLSGSDKMMLCLGTCIKGLQHQEGWESLVTFHVWRAHVHGHTCLGVNVHAEGCRLIWEIIVHCSPTLLRQGLLAKLVDMAGFARQLTLGRLGRLPCLTLILVFTHAWQELNCPASSPVPDEDS